MLVMGPRDQPGGEEEGTHLGQGVLAAAFKGVALSIKGDEVAVPVGHAHAQAGLAAALPPAVPAGAVRRWGGGCSQSSPSEAAGHPCAYTLPLPAQGSLAVGMHPVTLGQRPRPLLHRMGSCEYGPLATCQGLRYTQASSSHRPHGHLHPR